MNPGEQSQIADPFVASRRPSSTSRSRCSSGIVPSAIGPLLRSRLPFLLTMSTNDRTNSSTSIARRRPRRDGRAWHRGRPERPGPRTRARGAPVVLRLAIDDPARRPGCRVRDRSRWFRWGVLRWCILDEESSDKTVTSARLTPQVGMKTVARPYSRWVAECLPKAFHPSQQDPTEPVLAQHLSR